MVRATLVTVCALLIASCGSSSHAATKAATRTHPAPPAPQTVSWQIVAHVAEPVDITTPRSDGRLVLAAAGRLFLFTPPARLTPFARGPGGYTTRPGLEPYIALTPALRLPGAGCSWHQDDVYALQPFAPLGVIRIDPSGRVSRFAQLPPGGQPDAITFDQVGSFGHRLLVSEEYGTNHSTLYAFDCRGRRTTVAATAPRLEGGITVAPETFGAFGGTLVAANEYNGNIIDISPSGRSRVLAASHLHFGGDIGVESTGFVPAGEPNAAAFVSDRYTAHHRYLGNNAIIELSPAALRSAGVRPGDLLVATEGGGLTVDVRCAASCTVRYIGSGPPGAYIEGHIEFAR